MTAEARPHVSNPRGTGRSGEKKNIVTSPGVPNVATG
jgi:hypothetical protein